MFQVKFFTSARGENLVKSFLDGLQAKLREKVVADIMFLEEYGYQAQRPKAALLRDKIYELRTSLGHLEVRLLYFFDKEIIILTHGFLKKSDAVPPNEITKALNIRTDYFARKG